jgi:hypothetical protein
MKKLIFLTIILTAILFGCHVNRSMTYITQSPKVKYKLQPIPDEAYPNYYIYSGKGYTQLNAALIDSLSAELDKLSKIKSEHYTLSPDHQLLSHQEKLEIMINQIPKDSIKNFIISFTDFIDGIDYAIVRTYWWDYSNWRFLLPFASYFNRWHNFNQCVNRAVEQCTKYNCDGVIIDGDYSMFKLFKVKN